MMADRQTTGGYAKIATVITADLHKIAQAKPGSIIRFQAVTEKEAVAALKQERKFLKQLQYETYFAR
jgi:allophanate hydrolase subunit 2